MDRSQVIDLHQTDALSVDAQSVDANSVDAQSVDAQSVDAQSIDAQSVDALSVELIGAKAKGLITMAGLGLRVPGAFVVSTDVCRAYLRDGALPAGIEQQVLDGVRRLEQTAGRSMGSGPGALSVSVRSGAAVSMPGMMDTLLDVERPESVVVAMCSVFESWRSDRAIEFRAHHGIDDELGTAAVVQAMVHGDSGTDGGAGVAFSRDPSTGAPGLCGDWLPGARGEQVVGGTAASLPISRLAEQLPLVFDELSAAVAVLERVEADMVDVEFVVEEGTLHFLQIRRGLRAAGAAVRIAVDLVDDGMITSVDAAERVSDVELARAQAPTIDVLAAPAPAVRGLGASPGVAVGALCTSPDRVAELCATSGHVVLVRDATSPADLHGMLGASGLLTRLGGPVSHAALVARELGLPAVVGVSDLRIDDVHGVVHLGGATLHEGDVISLDGSTGQVWLGQVPVVAAAPDDHVRRLRAWKGHR